MLSTKQGRILHTTSCAIPFVAAACAWDIAEGWKLSMRVQQPMSVNALQVEPAEVLRTKVLSSTGLEDDNEPVRNPFTFSDITTTERTAGSQTPLEKPIVAAPGQSQTERLQLLGTIYDPSGASMAICTLGANVPRALIRGSKIGMFRIDSIQPGYIVVTDSSAVTIIVRLRSRG